ncbi:MAG: hypothetical protein G01um10142_195 [Parcubacteria group bacterium Gr01-1014_2]|nr:MAG: hypothetical protein G01um10142_195 [Parcubacteria group bacterium Gr01-1014_2]
MNYQHKNLAAGRWFTFSFFEQMANIGSEVERAMKWQTKNDEYSRLASDRALELLDLTISDAKNHKRLKELFRLREVLADYFYFDNIYKSDNQKWHNYFNAFNYAAMINAN